MLISSLRHSTGPPAWLRVSCYTTKSAVDFKMTSLEPHGQPEVPSQPKGRRKRLRRPKNLPWHASAATSLLNRDSNTMQDVESISHQRGPVSMTLEPQQLQVQPQLQPPPRRDSPWKSATVSKALLSSGSNTIQGLESVVQQLRTVSIDNKELTRPAAQSALAPNVSKQAPSPPSKLPTAQDRNKSAEHKASKRATRSKKVSPSKGSGGIPDPTSEYLRASLDGPSQLGQPQYLLVVIDLNGTLLYRPNRSNPTRFLMRPHAQSFLRYCVDTFNVVIWSSARPENVSAMCSTILAPDIKNKVVAIWGRDKFGLTKDDFNLRVQCYKRLAKVWQDQEIAQSHPLYYEGFRWDQTNTVLIDDSREKARTEPYNLIEVPEWFGDLNERDGILPQVHDYLNHLSMHSNVSACLKSHSWQPTVF